MPPVVGVVVMAVPVLLALVFALILRSGARARRAVAAVPAGWARAAGVVTDEHVFRRERRATAGSRDLIGPLVRQPVVTFRPPSGPEVTFRSTISATSMPRPGATVGVLYDPSDPRRARLAPESVPRTGRGVSTVAIVVGVLLFLPLAAAFELVGWFLLTQR